MLLFRNSKEVGCSDHVTLWMERRRNLKYRISDDDSHEEHQTANVVPKARAQKERTLTADLIHSAVER